MKRRDTREICEEIKSIISPFLGDRKVFNRDVSEVLGINASTLNTRIKRDTPPMRRSYHGAPGPGWTR